MYIHTNYIGPQGRGGRPGGRRGQGLGGARGEVYYQ